MSRFEDILNTLKEEHRFRSIPTDMASGALDLSSNDYLSLGSRSSLFMPEFLDRFPDASFSSSASRLLSSRQKYHYLLEETLAGLYNRSALLFNSGYHANVGCISALTLPDTLFICDRLVHASVVDGLKMAGSRFVRFPHNDIAKLEKIIEKERDNYSNLIVVVESIYSMDGDTAPLRQIVGIKKRNPGLLLYIDEAHAFGVRGRKGLGLSEELGLIDDIDLIVGTLGKAAASTGAFVISSHEIINFLTNTARPFIFSTALPPVNAAWSLFMIQKIIGMEEERRRLAELSRYFSERSEEITGHPTGSDSQIIPLLTGDAAAALALAARLRENNIIALPIRRPTVPPGGERIRFSLCADMREEDFNSLFDILSSYYS